MRFGPAAALESARRRTCYRKRGQPVALMNNEARTLVAIYRSAQGKSLILLALPSLWDEFHEQLSTFACLYYGQMLSCWPRPSMLWPMQYR
jgi:hypothetical protein